MDHIRVKVFAKGSDDTSSAPPVVYGNCIFHWDCSLTDYDWLIVYDDFPEKDKGTIKNEVEVLRCSPDHTLLVTAEPPSIKLYGTPYLNQFKHVLTTHNNVFMKHPHHMQKGGALMWYYGKSYEKIQNDTEFPKTKDISTVCSSKAMNHTLHAKRLELTQYLAQHLTELEWYGHGIKPLPYDEKHRIIDPYRYHIAVENYNGPHHWTEKIADAFLGLSLPFYSGHESIKEYFPEDSLILIPVDDPPKALKIIQEAIADNAYEKRLPAIKEARRRILQEHNFWALTSQIIEKNFDPTKKPVNNASIKGRHTLRRNPINLLKLAYENMRYKLSSHKD